jgi:hypothetical protein
MEDVPNAPLLYAEQPDEDEAGAVTVWYRKSNNADTYNIYYGKEPGVYTRKITGVTFDSYSISGLKSGQPYYVAVTAVNSSGESAIWNERCVTPTGSTPNWTEEGEEGIYIAPPKPTDNGSSGNGTGNNGNAGVGTNPAGTTNNNGTSQGTVNTAQAGSTGAGNGTTGTASADDTKINTVKKSKVVIKSVKSRKKGIINLTWKKVTAADGYQITVAVNKKMNKGKKQYDVKKGKTTSKNIKGLKSKKTYYVKIRAYVKSEGKKVFGKFSKVKNVKVK